MRYETAADREHEHDIVREYFGPDAAIEKVNDRGDGYDRTDWRVGLPDGRRYLVEAKDRYRYDLGFMFRQGGPLVSASKVVALLDNGPAEGRVPLVLWRTKDRHILAAHAAVVGTCRVREDFVRKRNTTGRVDRVDPCHVVSVDLCRIRWAA